MANQVVFTHFTKVQRQLVWNWKTIKHVRETLNTLKLDEVLDRTLETIIYRTKINDLEQIKIIKKKTCRVKETVKRMKR